MKTRFLLIICFVSKVYTQQVKDNFISIDTIAVREAGAYSSVVNTKKATSASENFDIIYYRSEWKVDPATHL